MPFEPAFVFAADLHLRPQTWTHHPDLRGDAFISLATIRAYCRNAKLPLVLGGDIFNSRRPDSLSVREFSNTVSYLDEDLGSYYIQGNHDYCGGVPWPGVVNAPNHLHHQAFQIGGILVYSLDWTPRERLAKELAKVPPEVEVLVCHQAWDELLGIGNTDGSIEELIPTHIRVLLTGDYHVALTRRFQRPSGRHLTVYSPGSTYMNKINEVAEKTFLVVGRDEGGLEAREVPIPTRRVCSVMITTSTDLDDFVAGDLLADVCRGCEDREEPIRKPIFEVAFHDDIPGAYERLVEFIGDRGHFFPQPIHIVDDVVVETDEDPDTFDTLLGAIRRMEEDPSIVDGVTRLLGAEKPAEELEIMSREHLDGAATASG